MKGSSNADTGFLHFVRFFSHEIFLIRRGGRAGGKRTELHPTQQLCHAIQRGCRVHGFLSPANFQIQERGVDATAQKQFAIVCNVPCSAPAAHYFSVKDELSQSAGGSHVSQMRRRHSRLSQPAKKCATSKSPLQAPPPPPATPAGGKTCEATSRCSRTTDPKTGQAQRPKRRVTGSGRKIKIASRGPTKTDPATRKGPGNSRTATA